MNTNPIQGKPVYDVPTPLASGDISTMSIEELMFFVMSRRTQLLEDGVRGYAKQMEERNKEMHKANLALSDARNISAGLGENDTAVLPPNLAEFIEANGIALPGLNSGKAEALAPQEAVEIAQSVESWLKTQQNATGAPKSNNLNLPANIINDLNRLGIPVPDGEKSGERGIGLSKDQQTALLNEVQIKIQNLPAQSVEPPAVSATPPSGQKPAPVAAAAGQQTAAQATNPYDAPLAEFNRIAGDLGAIKNRVGREPTYNFIRAGAKGLNPATQRFLRKGEFAGFHLSRLSEGDIGAIREKLLAGQSKFNSTTVDTPDLTPPPATSTSPPNTGASQAATPQTPAPSNTDVASVTNETGQAATSNAGRSFTKEEWQSIISSLQGHQEKLNNESQLDMIKFQSLLTKFNTQVEMLSNTMRKVQEALSSIVRNIS
ncbi:MAG: hypothetical protein KDA80_04960 [Planctomycetaceae bacterium]|nr:hypothetical protein [Planctomycetaceae bacterium]